jgi:hypothetical protein
MNCQTHLVLCKLEAGKVGILSFGQDVDLIQKAKEIIPSAAPFVVVEKTLRETLPEQNWQNVNIDWTNPDGYGERVIPTPTE